MVNIYLYILIRFLDCSSGVYFSLSTIEDTLKALSSLTFNNRVNIWTLRPQMSHIYIDEFIEIDDLRNTHWYWTYDSFPATLYLFQMSWLHSTLMLHSFCTHILIYLHYNEYKVIFHTHKHTFNSECKINHDTFRIFHEAASSPKHTLYIFCI